MTAIEFLEMIQTMILIAKIAAIVLVISLIFYIVECIREKKKDKREGK